jgi:hypothetical protein
MIFFLKPRAEINRPSRPADKVALIEVSGNPSQVWSCHVNAPRDKSWTSNAGLESARSGGGHHIPGDVAENM